ncbi:GumC family protein [Rhizobium sp. CSW-27]|uniref:GumC family protein n=1 Tax=Rhizobium sp. CSW-27 TaxID=2839985 RepID=UPI001C019810|nr:GumC family protein [Rhizobium sp. CSW-27]MBT9369086.1 GumC family protein [Rhizobium sp. CSW-27]
MYRPGEPARSGMARPAQAAATRTVGSLLDHALAETATERGAPMTRHPAASPATATRAPGATDGLEARLDSIRGNLASIGAADLMRMVHGGWRLIAALTLAGLVAALLYALTATPRFTASTEIVINPSNLNLVADDVFAASPQRDTQQMEVESKLRLLTSGSVLLQVIRDLDLTRDDEFFRPGLLAGLISEPAGPQDRELAVLRALERRVTATRDATSFVVTVSVWSTEPEKSVRLAAAVVKAFENQLFESASDSAGRLAATINSRLDELRRSVSEAEERVETFKRENGLQQAQGELTSTRKASTLDTQVLDAQQRLIQAEARAAQMRAALSAGRMASDAVFDSATMTALRASYTALDQQVSALSLTYGARHPRLVSLQSERSTVEKAMTEEAQRILAGASADVEEARASLAALKGKASDERATVFTDNDAQVALRELERDARAKASVYETYLARTHQIAERQQIDTSNVQVISAPVPPHGRSWPPGVAILAPAGALAGALLGLGLAMAAGLWRHALRPADRASAPGVFRSPF